MTAAIFGDEGLALCPRTLLDLVGFALRRSLNYTWGMVHPKRLMEGGFGPLHVPNVVATTGIVDMLHTYTNGYREG